MSIARQIMKSENEMLQGLISHINEFAKKYKGLEADNLKCWGKELSGYCDINNTYIKLEDNKLEEALTEEADSLTKCRDSIEESSASAKYWRKNLDENIWYTNQLIPLVRRKADPLS